MIVFTPNTVIKSADINLNFAEKVTYNKYDITYNPVAIFTYSSFGSTGGQVFAVGTSYFAFDVFNTNNQTVITKQANGIFKVSEAGYYYAVLNYSTSDVTSSDTSSIFVSTDNSTYYQVSPWTVNQSVPVNRGFMSVAGFYLSANNYVKAALDVGTQTRIASWSTSNQKYMTSFTLMRIG